MIQTQSENEAHVLLHIVAYLDWAWLSCTQDYMSAAVFMQRDRITPSKAYWVLSDNIDFIRSFM